LLDTAGIRESSEPVEQEGMRRARERAAAADLILWVNDASAAGPAAGGPDKGFGSTPIWLVENKADLTGGTPRLDEVAPDKNECLFKISISARTGFRMDNLEGALSKFAKNYFSATESTLITRARHRHALEETVAALDRASAPANAQHEELIAEELRAAATTLGRLTGRVDVEDILDVIFRDFCIGK
jgi:tRNA modification GTPase